MTKVQFLREANGQILAVFPATAWDGFSNIDCYSRVGQHSSCAVNYWKNLKPATRLEFEPLLEELESLGYDDLKVVIPTKKAFKEALRCDLYTSTGHFGRIRSWVCFWDWDPGVYGERSAGYKFGCSATGVRKADLIDQFYNYLFVNGIRPDYSILKVAETDQERFKVPLCLTW
jgi:hypothetical protein